MTDLMKLEGASRALSEARNLSDIAAIRDMAQAAAEYAKAAKLGMEASNYAAEIRIRAERKAGELLGGLKRGQGKRTDQLPDIVSGSSEYRQALNEAEVDERKAQRWQEVARIDDELFEDHIATTKQGERELTTAGVLKSTQGMGVHYSSKTDDWATPQSLFDVLNSEFGFDLDVCASTNNHKCEVYYTAEDDGLAQDWTGTCWMNPPYGSGIGQWIEKAHDSALKGATVVCLVPARTDTRWWWKHCIFGEIRFLRGRLKFGGGDTSAPFPSAVIVFYPGTPSDDASVVWWEDGRNDL